MEDTIQGPVTDIFNEDTFAMKVIRLGKHNRREYDSEEIIHIEVIDAPRGACANGRAFKTSA